MAMKYKLANALFNLDGSVIKGPNGEPITFRNVCTACLVQATDKATEDKVAAFQLAVKIEAAAASGEVSALTFCGAGACSTSFCSARRERPTI